MMSPDPLVIKSEYDEPTKQIYSTPQLEVYGSIVELTRGGQTVNPSDVASSTDFNNVKPSK